MQWFEEEEGDLINAKIIKETAEEVPVSEVQEGNGATSSGDGSVLPLLSDETDGRDSDRDTDEDES